MPAFARNLWLGSTSGVATTETDMIRRLLIAYNGSDAAKGAFNFARDLAGEHDAELHVSAVAQVPIVGADVETKAVIEHERQHCDLILQPLRARVAGLRVHFNVSFGDPVVQIVRYAESHQIDHIVVGHRGRSVVGRWLAGSTAERVMARAQCSVSAIR